jgi:ankyrin repeat protein
MESGNAFTIFFYSFPHISVRSMSACNQYGESLIHLACRRSSFQIVQFLLTHGASAVTVDDFGRTPFHDACWRPDPRFDIIVCLLQHSPELIRCQDIRGSFALAYICKDNWAMYCAFLFHQRDLYWPKLN